MAAAAAQGHQHQQPHQRPAVLITGCTKGGIGYALAAEFARRGCQVFATARKVASMAGLAELGCILLPLDVTDAAAIKAAAKSVDKATGGRGLDVLVNNAGLLAKAPALEAEPDHFRRQLEVNFLAAVALNREFGPAMVARRGGCIVNVGSIASYTSQPFWSAYSASKAALMSYSDALRVELAPFKVAVVYCAPGFIATRLDDNAKASSLNAVDPQGPWGVLGVQKWVASTEGVADGTPPEEFARGFASMALAALRQGGGGGRRAAAAPLHYVSGKLSAFVWWLGWLAPAWVMDKLYTDASGLKEVAAREAARVAKAAAA